MSHINTDANFDDILLLFCLKLASIYINVVVTSLLEIRGFNRPSVNVSGFDKKLHLLKLYRSNPGDPPGVILTHPC